MSTHPMPTVVNEKIVEKIVVIPTMSKSLYNKQRPMWVGHVYVSIYEKPVFTSMECFSPSGAACVCEAWMSKHGYIVALGFPVQRSF